ncbi:MAG TPA: ABC transporter permease, partial [Candidatus Thermoplasmatota archaeon]|nr:ABC transporter permease [Candidatus Thermoplasmatota archaeon]
MVLPSAGAGRARGRPRSGGSRLWTLYVGELHPLVTNKASFALFASVTGLLGLISMAFLYEAVELYFICAYILLPSFTTVFAATTYTRDRASGFASVVQTVPVTRAEYFVAKFLSSMTLGALFLVLTTPFTVLAGYFLGASHLWTSYGHVLLAALPLMAASTCLGLFISVALGRRGLLASAMTGFAVTILFAGISLMLREMKPAFGNELAMQREAESNFLFALLREITNLSHLSPFVNALDFYFAYPSGDALAWKALFTMLWFALVFGAGAWALFAYLQNVEGWDAPRLWTLGVVAGVLVVGASPVFAIEYAAELGPAQPSAMESPTPYNHSYDVRALLLPRGEPLP